MIRFFILTAFLATTTLAEEIATQCAINASELPISFQVEGCNSAPCFVPMLEDAVFNIKFRAPRNSKGLRTRVNVFLMSIIYFPLNLGPASETCNGLTNASCPVKEGQDLEFTLKVPIEEFILLNVTLPIEISVLDDTNAPVFCARVPMVVTEPRHLK